MVGRFAGWLINFPALPNCVSMSQNSKGGSSTMSLTLEDHTFPVALFSMCRSVCHAQFRQSYIQSAFKVPFAGLLVFEICSVSYLEGRWCAVHCLLCGLEMILIHSPLGNG